MAEHESEKLIQSLLTADGYAHAVDEVKVIETHISWVLLAGDFVYKFKKPVDFGFLDFSTLEKRLHFCQEELRLNSRFTSDLYLDVVAVSDKGGKPQIVGLADTEKPLEYAVRMRQFDQSALLDQLAEVDGLSMEDMVSLGRHLATFHADVAERLQPATLAANDERQAFGSAEQVLKDALDNFSDICQHVSDDDLLSALDTLAQWTRDRFTQLHVMLTRRRQSGFVRECHGDLHLGNIARIDGQMTFFDCIEFNPALRWIDTQSELAFLLMDMEVKGLPGLANRLLNTYLEFSGDYEGLPLLSFFKAYRAMVRAKVTILNLVNEDHSEESQAELMREFTAYLDLAISYSRDTSPFLALMHGVSGTGKSTVAARLAMEKGAVYIRSDVERKRLFGIRPDTRSSEAQEKALYTSEVSRRTFDELQRLAAFLLDNGFSVIADATFLEQKARTPFITLATQRQLPFMIVDCQASEEALVARLTQRKKVGGDASDAGVDIMRSQLKVAGAFTAVERPFVVSLDTEQVPTGALLATLEPKVA